MPKRFPQVVKDNIDKCMAAATAAVETYNRPGRRFRTAQYIVLIAIAWTALFHAIFYRRNRRPWYRKKTSGTSRGIRYKKVDGEPKHWELSECLTQYFGADNPPERRNVEFLIGLRNKIEHRHVPALDASLYGECQAALLNLEALLTQQFGEKYSLTDELAVSLQFSRTVPSEKRVAAKSLATHAAKSVKDYVERFRGNLPSTVLNSMKYSFNVFLVPKVANRLSAADVSVQFVHVDEASQEELKRLERLNVLIREKHIPIANLDLHKPGQVVQEVRQHFPFRFTMGTHTAAWHHFQVRPPTGATNPERTKSQYCVYDPAHRDYLYTEAWIKKLLQDMSEQDTYERVTGSAPIRA